MATPPDSGDPPVAVKRTGSVSPPAEGAVPPAEEAVPPPTVGTTSSSAEASVLIDAEESRPVEDGSGPSNSSPIAAEQQTQAGAGSAADVSEVTSTPAGADTASVTWDAAGQEAGEGLGEEVANSSPVDVSPPANWSEAGGIVTEPVTVGSETAPAPREPENAPAAEQIGTSPVAVTYSTSPAEERPEIAPVSVKSQPAPASLKLEVNPLRYKSETVSAAVTSDVRPAGVEAGSAQSPQEFNVLNPDGLTAGPSGHVAMSASEAQRPSAPPPSQMGVAAGGADPAAQRYWQGQLQELSQLQDADLQPDDTDRRPDQMGLGSPEQHARLASQTTQPADVPPELPVNRSGRSPFPLAAPELSHAGGSDDGMFSELADGLGSDDDTARGAPYPLYPRPDGGDSPSSDAPAGDWAPVLADRSGSSGGSSGGSPRPSPRASSAGGGDRATGEVAVERPVLPPDHPLMARFQRALTALLRRRINQLDLDIVQLNKEQRATAKQRETAGVQLYERQLQLSRQQQQQQQQAQLLREAVQVRRSAEVTLQEVHTSHQEHRNKLETDRGTEKQLRLDVGNLEKHEYHLKSLENDADTELQLRHKMAERADAEMSALEQSKQRQDYLIARLSSDSDRLQTAIRLNEVQCGAQAEECNLARQVLAEAQLELDTLGMEKRHLTQTWTNSLNTMQKRDEQHAQLQSDISKMSAGLHTMDGDIAGYIRSIATAQDNNEQLTMQLHRLRSERDRFQRGYDEAMAKFDVQKEEYSRFHRVVSDSEDKLFQTQLEQQQVERKLKHIVADMERVTDLKRQVEDLMLETMRERLTADNAGRYAGKIIRKTRDVTKYMEGQVADVENNIARLLLAVSNASTSVTYMNTVVEQLLAEVRLAEENLNRYQVEVHRGNTSIQHKQNKVQEFNTKLGILIAAAGGQELGPLEIIIASLHKAIDSLQAEVDTVQQYYIRLQNDLVLSTHQRDDLSHLVMIRKKELLIMDQRKLRVERSIESESGSLHAVELSVKQLRQAVCHLNVRLAGETQLHVTLAADTSVIEYQLCHALRETETECVQMRGQIGDKDRLRATMLCRMAQAGETELLWEQKIGLLKQAKQKLHGETGCATEVRGMRLEIHRMQVRYGQLLREQERLMTEMERAVDRRETIAMRAENADRLGRQRAANFFQRQKRIEDLKRKFKAVRRDAAHLSSELTRAERQLSYLDGDAVPSRRASVARLKDTLTTLQWAVERAGQRRSQNLGRIVLKQQSSKFYQSMLEGHYSPLVRSESRLQLEVDSADEKYKSVRMLVRQILRDHPELEPRFEFVKEILHI